MIVTHIGLFLNAKKGSIIKIKFFISEILMVILDG
jgi:hypothetical protein